MSSILAVIKHAVQENMITSKEDIQKNIELRIILSIRKMENNRAERCILKLETTQIQKYSSIDII